MHLSQYMPALHTLSGLIILATSFYCVFLLIINFGALYLDHLHNLVGFIILCLVTLISLGGMATAFVKRSVKWNTKFIVRFKVAHRVLGFLTWLFAIFVTCTGLESYSELWLNGETNYLIWINGSLMVLIFLICELTFRKLRSGEDKWVTNELEKVYTVEQFEKLVSMGEKLWILDDMVLDLTNFMPNHPGG